MPETDDGLGSSSLNNINYFKTKISGVKEIIMEKIYEILQRIFQNFVSEYENDKNPVFKNKLMFYSLLKTEGDIMVELGDYNKALQAYKALRNYCRKWGPEYREQEMWMSEQIGMTYR